MKLGNKILLFLLGGILLFYISLSLFKGTSAAEVPANTAFDDINFYKCVVDAYNELYGKSVAYTTSLTDSQLASVHILHCDGADKSEDEKIVSAKGVEKLTTLQDFRIKNNNLTALDVSKNTKLLNFQPAYNKLTKLDVSKNTQLMYLVANDNQLTSLDVSKNTKLDSLTLSNNQLTSLDISKNTALRYLNIRVNKLSSLNTTGITTLVTVNASNNYLKTLDVSKNTKLTELYISSNQLTNLNVGTNLELIKLEVKENQLTSLDVSKNTKLTELYVENNKLTSLNLSGAVALEYAYVSSNQLTKLDAINNLALKWLYVDENKLSSLNLSGASSLKILEAEKNQLTSLDVSKNTKLTRLDVRENKLTSLDISKNTSLTSLNMYNNLIGDTCNLYKNSTCTVKEKIKFPTQWVDTTSTWSSYSSSIATVDSSTGLVTAKNDGTTWIRRTHSMSSLVYSHTINVFEITSDRYIIDNTNGYVLVFDKDATTIKNNIKVTDGGTVTVDLANNKLYVKTGSTTLKEFKLIVVTSSVYDLTSDYIYLGANKFSSSNVSISGGGSITTSGNKLYIKGGNVVLKEIDLATISSSVYDLTKSYINLESESFSASNITAVNCTVSFSSTKVIIRNGNITLQEFSLVGISSTTYDLSKDYIYLGVNGKLDISKITVSNGTAVEENNKLVIKKDSEVLLSFDLVSVSSDTYDLSKEYIYLGMNDLDTTKISVINGKVVVENNKLIIKYGDTELDSRKLVKISSTTYNLENEYVYLGTSKLDTSKITVVNGSIVEENNSIVVKYGDTELDSRKLVKISSTTYNLENEYIYLGVNGSLDLTKINVINGTREGNNNKLVIKYGDTVVDEKYLVAVSSSTYNLDEGYIYLGVNGKLDLTKVNVINGNKEVSDDNKVIIKYKDVKLYEIDLVILSSSIYDLNKSYLYVGYESLDLSSVVATNALMEVEDDKFYVKYNNDILKQYKLISFDTSYNIIDEYMYVGKLTNGVILTDVDVDNGYSSIDNNILQIKYNDEVLDEFKLVRISVSDLVITSDNKIYVGNKSDDNIKKNLKVTNGNFVINGNNLEIYVGDNSSVIAQIPILSINFDTLNVSDSVITLEDNLSYSQFTGYITSSDGITYKMFNSSSQVTSGDIADGMILKIYYNNKEVGSYSILGYKLIFDNSLNIDEDNKYINDLGVGTTLNEFLDKVSVRGANSKIVLYDDDGNKKSDSDVMATGDKLITYSGDTKKDEYVVSVTGDLNGDGKTNSIDLVQMRKHIVGWVNPNTNVIEKKTGVYYYALDMNKDGKINSIDLVRMRKRIVGLDEE